MDWPQNVTGILSIFVNGCLNLGQGATGPHRCLATVKAAKSQFSFIGLLLTILLFPVTFFPVAVVALSESLKEEITLGRPKFLLLFYYTKLSKQMFQEIRFASKNKT